MLLGQIFFHQTWEIFGYYVFNYSLYPFLSLFSLSHCAYIGMQDGIQITETLFIFLYSFSFSSSDWIISINLASSFLILSSAHSNLLLSFSRDFSFQLLYFSTPEFLFGSIFIISVSLLIFSIFCEILFSYFSFYSLDIVFFSSLNIVTIVDLSLCLLGLLSLGTLSIIAFFPPMAHIFQFLCMYHSFLLKTGHTKQYNEKLGKSDPESFYQSSSICCCCLFSGFPGLIL